MHYLCVTSGSVVSVGPVVSVDPAASGGVRTILELFEGFLGLGSV